MNGKRTEEPIDQFFVAGVDDPAGGRLADHLAESEFAIAFGEVLAVGQRHAIGDEHRRALQRALAEDAARGLRILESPEGHVEVRLARQHVERVGVDGCSAAAAWRSAP
jgi:hypothetical protein